MGGKIKEPVTQAQVDEVSKRTKDLNKQIAVLATGTERDIELMKEANLITLNAEGQVVAANEQAQDNYKELISKSNTSLEELTTQLTKSIKEETAMKAEMGTLGGYVRNMVVENYAQMMKGMANITLKGVNALTNNEATGDEITKITEDMFSPWREQLSTQNTTKEFAEKFAEEHFITSTVLQAGAQLPEMLTPYGAGIFFQTYGSAADEVVDLDLSPAEKEVYKIGAATIETALEQVGLTKALKRVPQLKRAIVGDFLSRMTTEATQDASKVAKEAVEGAMSRFLKDTGEATIAEGFTGGLQETSNILLKEGINAVTDGEGFGTKTLFEYGKQVLEAAAAEAIGGAALSGTINSVVGFSEGKLPKVPQQDLELATMLMTPDGMESYTNTVNTQVESGKLSKEGADILIRSANELVQTINKLPEEFRTNPEAIQLVAEKSKLVEANKNLDPAFQEKNKIRIEEIDNKLFEMQGIKTEKNGQTKEAQEGGVRDTEAKEATTPAKEEIETPVKGDEDADGGITDYIKNIAVDAKMSIDIDPIVEKMSRAENISDEDINKATERLLEEADRVQNSSEYSDQAKKQITDRLLNLAEKIDNYEFRTKTETVTTTERTTSKSPRASATKVVAERFFENTTATVNGENVKFRNNNGRVETTLSDGSVFILDTPTLTLKDGGITFNESGNVETATFVDRNGNESTFAGETALDLVIKTRENEIGTVPQGMFDVVVEEVVKESKVEKPYIKEKAVPNKDEIGDETNVSNQPSQVEGTTEGTTEGVKSETPEAKLGAAWKNWKSKQQNAGIIYDFKSKAKEDVELFKAVAEYLKEKTKQGAYKLKQFVADVAQHGISNSEARQLYLALNPNLDLNKRRRQAVKNVKASKLGKLGNSLAGVLSVPIELIDDAFVDSYIEALDYLGQRKAVLSGDEYTKHKKAIDDAVFSANIALGSYDEAADSVEKRLKNGEDYQDILTDMFVSSEISEAEYEYFKKHKFKKPTPPKSVNPKVVLQQSQITVPTLGLSERQSEVVKILKGLTEEDIKNLGDKAKHLPEITNAINNGFIPYAAVELSRRIVGNRQSKILTDNISKYSKIWVNKLRDVFKSTKDPVKVKARLKERGLQAASSKNIDSTLGLKGNAVGNIVENGAKGYAALTTEMEKIYAEITQLMNKIPQKNQRKADIITSLFTIQRQKNFNPNNDTVKSVKQLIEKLNSSEKNKTIYKEAFGEDGLNLVMELYEKYKNEDGEFDINAAYKDMSVEERKLISYHNLLTKKNLDYAIDAAAERGEYLSINKAYTHLSVLAASVDDLQNMDNIADAIRSGKNFKLVSTRGGALKKRTSGVPIAEFSIVASMVNGSKDVLTDFYLTRPLRIEGLALNKTSKDLENSKIEGAVADGIKDAIFLQRNMMFAEQAAKAYRSAIAEYIAKSATAGMLGTVKKAVGEIVSNSLAVAIRDIANKRPPLKTLYNALVSKGMGEYKGKLYNDVVEVMKPKQQQRIVAGEVFGGMQTDIDTSSIEEYSIYTKNKDQKVATFMNKWFFNWGNKHVSPKKISELFVQKTDQLFARGMYFTEFESTFKKLTGEKPDYKKIATKDAAYMDKYSEELSKANNAADTEIVSLFSTTNTAEKSFYQLSAAKKGGLLGRFKYFMQPFQITDYQNLRDAVYQEGKGGVLKTGIPIIARQIIYQMILQEMGKVMAYLVGGGDDDDLDEIMGSMFEKDDLIRASVATMISLALFRDASNLVKVPAIIAIETANYFYGQKVGLRQEEESYDTYKNSMFYSQIPIGEPSVKSSLDIATTSIGMFAPQLSPLLKGGANLTIGLNDFSAEDNEFESDAGRYRFIKGSLGIANSLGIIPKDVENAYTYSKNKDLIIYEGGERGGTGIGVNEEIDFPDIDFPAQSD